MSESGVLPWVTREDLVTVEMPSNPEQPSRFVVKDPVKDEFFHFGDVEIFILERLRTEGTVGSLREQLLDRFGQRWSELDVIKYVQRLAMDNLVLAKRMGDGERLYSQNKRENSSALPRFFLGLLSIKLPGIYPRFLPIFRPIGWLLFNSLSLTLFALTLIGTMVYGLASFRTLVEHVPTWSQLVEPDHLFMMLIGFVVVKLIHELGHALACQHAGHECSEMGVMFLVFIPCLYCDVSDMWSERSRWKRILVSLSGVYVELAIAIVCFWGWCLTLDGKFNQFLFSLMLVTSVNTLFINGNPLMRYDGYYALSDFVRIPNLSSVARSFLMSRVEPLFVAMKADAVDYPKPVFLSCFAIASTVYRWFILFAIGWGIWLFFEGVQLKSIGKIAVSCILVISIIPMLITLRGLVSKMFSHGIRLVNVTVFVAIIAFFLIGAFQINFSNRVWGTAMIQLSASEPVFVSSEGFVITFVADGDYVETGQLLATLEVDELALERITLENDFKEVGMRIRSLELESDSQATASELKFWNERKASLESKRKDLELREKSMEVRSASAGRLVATRYSTPEDDVRLDGMNGVFFDEANQGRFVRRGEVLGHVGDPSRFTGFLEVDEKDIDLIDLGQDVHLLVPNSNQQFVGKVTKIALEALESRKSRNVQEGLTDSKAPKYYTVEFELEANGRLRVGSEYRAVVRARETTLAKRISRWWQNSVFW